MHKVNLVTYFAICNSGTYYQNLNSNDSGRNGDFCTCQLPNSIALWDKVDHNFSFYRDLQFYSQKHSTVKIFENQASYSFNLWCTFAWEIFLSLLRLKKKTVRQQKEPMKLLDHKIKTLSDFTQKITCIKNIRYTLFIIVFINHTYIQFQKQTNLNFWGSRYQCLLMAPITFPN